jgi:multiple sugar transport system permease protein
VDFGVAPPPRPAKYAAKPISWTGGWAYAIPSTAKHARAGWEFIRFMISDRALLIINNVNRDIAEAQGRLFIPGQCPVKEINELLFQRFVYDHPTMPERLKQGCRAFNDLLPHAMYRPVTPVGQRLWNEHVTAMEQACLGQAAPQAVLDDCTQKVQFWVEKHYDTSKKGVPIASWTWFFVLYPLLLAALAVGVFFWDTHLEFRRRLARLLHLAGARADAVVEGSKGGYFRSQWWGGLVCVSPWLIGFIIFGGGPLLFSLVISFCDYDILRPPEYVGLQNFHVLFTQDDNFGTSLGNTVYMVLGVPLGMFTGLAVALLLNLKIRGMAVWRTFFYLPAIVPMVASSILWIWILNANGGFINKVLGFFGIPGPLWLDSPAWSKPAIIVMGLWGAGASMIIWLAGLKAIDPSLYEAADVDGANEWQKLWHITLPQLTPFIFFNLVMGLIGTFQIFGQAFIMTQGGPGNSTLFYVYYLFNNAFRYGHMGYAAAMAWVLFVIVLGLTIVQLKLSKRWVHYEAG